MKIVSANWKMNGSLEGTRNYFEYLSSKKIDKDKRLIFCIPYVFLQEAVHLTKYIPNLEIFSQNVHHEDSGSFTGEISASMLKSIGVNGALVGHSERRNTESSDIINKKIKSLLRYNLKTILCIGESKNEDPKKVIINQISESLKDIKSLHNIIFAYEPVWSIGSDSAADISHIKNISDIVSDYCHKKYDSCPEIIYGGSVNETNFNEILLQEDLSGILIGRFSLDIYKFSRFICSEKF